MAGQNFVRNFGRFEFFILVIDYLATMTNYEQMYNISEKLELWGGMPNCTPNIELAREFAEKVVDENIYGCVWEYSNLELVARYILNLWKLGKI